MKGRYLNVSAEVPLGCGRFYFKPSGQLLLISLFRTAAKGINCINVTILLFGKCKYVPKVSIR